MVADNVRALREVVWVPQEELRADTAGLIEVERSQRAAPKRSGAARWRRRLERLFRTFKETIFRGRWMLVSVKQLDRYCADFVTFYNRDRPHSAFGGRTPDEVYFKLNFHRALGPVTYFDGALEW